MGAATGEFKIEEASARALANWADSFACSKVAVLFKAFSAILSRAPPLYDDLVIEGGGLCEASAFGAAPDEELVPKLLLAA